MSAAEAISALTLAAAGLVAAAYTLGQIRRDRHADRGSWLHIAPNPGVLNKVGATKLGFRPFGDDTWLEPQLYSWGDDAKIHLVGCSCPETELECANWDHRRWGALPAALTSLESIEIEVRYAIDLATPLEPVWVAIVWNRRSRLLGRLRLEGRAISVRTRDHRQSRLRYRFPWFTKPTWKRVKTKKIASLPDPKESAG
ncbi:hypothetical protein IDH50_06825 [Aeromicrobium tamlense]|uniref:Uncharacterized protein n=1 Tax=Aeromicrobium tamlense TaxID=375541 RepID=A0A8I0FVP9_9ACTN|nr:hypothetical protein [Aeromicrobium tamlense]MBD1269936.1 hypothetical protein [Aeromicrobium tamlense]NYI39407.1 hypothetical protein [Aeromicrobium tamlense]